MMRRVHGLYTMWSSVWANRKRMYGYYILLAIHVIDIKRSIWQLDNAGCAAITDDGGIWRPVKPICTGGEVDLGESPGCGLVCVLYIMQLIQHEITAA